jgi:hypothetical protein
METNNNALNAEQVDLAERQAGRRLTPNEVLVGRNLSKRPDPRSSREKLDDSQNFRVVMLPPKEMTPAESAVAVAEAEVAKARVAALNPAERRLEMVRKWRADEVAKAEAAEAHRQQLAKPEIAKAIKDLESLRAQLEFRPETTARQVQEIEAAMANLVTAGADTSVGLARTKAIFDARKSALQQQHEEKLALIRRQADLAEMLRQEIETLEGPTPPEVVTGLEKVEAELAEIRKQRDAADAKHAELLKSLGLEG